MSAAFRSALVRKTTFERRLFQAVASVARNDVLRALFRIPNDASEAAESLVNDGSPE
jgi:hypothetical protein